MVLAIEPMVNAGGYEVEMGDDAWAIYTKDGSLSAHFEHTVAITKRGPDPYCGSTGSECEGVELISAERDDSTVRPRRFGAVLR